MRLKTFGAALLAALCWLSSVSEAQAPVVTDRNGGTIGVGMFVNIPCIITAITPSLNPATTSVSCQTLPNVGSAEYDEGLTLIVYPAQTLKR